MASAPWASPPAALHGSTSESHLMKIATWNVNSLGVRLPQVLDWLAANQPDVLCMQETKLPDDKFTHAEFKAVGYESEWFGQKTYNGVALISKTPATDVARNIFGFDD